jgi:hypothetical protein
MSSWRENLVEQRESILEIPVQKIIHSLALLKEKNGKEDIYKDIRPRKTGMIRRLQDSGVDGFFGVIHPVFKTT